MKILHVINSSVIGGGAQEMLRKLTRNTGNTIEQRLVTLMTPQGAVLGMQPDHCLGIGSSIGLPSAVMRLRRIIRAEAPDVICSWMYASCLLTTLARPSDIPLVWNIRHSVHDISLEKHVTRLTIRACALLSSLPKATIYCAQTAVSQHDALGFRDKSTVIIPNGFDTSRFSPSGPKRRKEARVELGLPANAVLLGNAGRWHPMKNHRGLLEAFGQLACERSNLHLVLAGIGIDSTNSELQEMVNALDLKGRVTLIGLQTDMPKFFGMLDVYVQASLWGEGFPNALGEAMSCGIPAVTTDVGDSALVVSNAGQIVRHGTAEDLSAGVRLMLQRLSSEDVELRTAARARIETHYALPEIIARYWQVMAEVATR